MAKINKRVKSFSPYAYTIKYRSLGASPFQKSSYIVSAINNYEENVVTQLKPNFNVLLNINLLYDINDECQITFEKANLIFNIFNTTFNHLDNISDKFNVTALKDGDNSTKLKVIVGKNDINYQWLKNNKELKINHNLYSSNIDFIIFNKDNVYVNNYSIKYISKSSLIISFPNELSVNDTYQIFFYDINNSNYFYTEIQQSDIKYNNLNKNLMIKNIYENNDIKILCKNFDNIIKNIFISNITPSFIFIEENIIMSIAQYKIKINFLIKEKNDFLLLHTDQSEEELYVINSNFKQIIDNINFYKEKLNFLIQHNYKYDIKNMIVYRRINNFKKFTIQLGISTSNIFQQIDDNFIKIKIIHNLHGVINYIITNTASLNMIVSPEVKYINNESIELIFNKNMLVPIFTITCFKIFDGSI